MILLRVSVAIAPLVWLWLCLNQSMVALPVALLASGAGCLFMRESSTQDSGVNSSQPSPL